MYIRVSLYLVPQHYLHAYPYLYLYLYPFRCLFARPLLAAKPACLPACLPVPVSLLALSAALIKFSLHNQKAPKNISLLNNPLDSELNVCKLFECRFHSLPFAAIRIHSHPFGLLCLHRSSWIPHCGLVGWNCLRIIATVARSIRISLPKSIGWH